MFYRSGKQLFSIGVGTTSNLKVVVAILRIIGATNGKVSDQEIRDAFSAFPDGSVTMTQKYILPQ
jgi:hypothetical protein